MRPSLDEEFIAGSYLGPACAAYRHTAIHWLWGVGAACDLDSAVGHCSRVREGQLHGGCGVGQVHREGECAVTAGGRSRAGQGGTCRHLQQIDLKSCQCQCQANCLHKL